jgi:hypothetical protein
MVVGILCPKTASSPVHTPTMTLGYPLPDAELSESTGSHGRVPPSRESILQREGVV